MRLHLRWSFVLRVATGCSALLGDALMQCIRVGAMRSTSTNRYMRTDRIAHQATTRMGIPCYYRSVFIGLTYANMGFECAYGSYW
ncbi:hypothetical protein BKA70DRAFT_1309341 [Coprinopsis sp. MPI-PUGE-AT-0042]|nr:hypothetical protein BKA70DRAFT_1309341 [Coprinopsis sp. MPI-PUGE-AT-0042]